jgi:segregation and condensation protein B
MNNEQLKAILEAALFAAERPLSIDELIGLFEDKDWRPDRKSVREALKELAGQCEGRGIELKEIASGYRYQVRKDFSHWLGRLFSERPPRYTRALLETLALIAYRQPITRGEIEDVRGVVVSTSIIKTLMEREWIRVLGHREVPGRPALFGTTREFLDSFNLKSLEELPPLSEIMDLDRVPDDLFAGPPPSRDGNDGDGGVRADDETATSGAD